MQNTNPIMLDTNFTIPISSTGKITIQEIKSLILKLQAKFPNNEFIIFVINELQALEKRISIRENKEEELLSAIDPKVLHSLPFNEVINSIIANKDYYFGLLQDLVAKETGQNPQDFIQKLENKNHRKRTKHNTN